MAEGVGYGARSVCPAAALLSMAASCDGQADEYSSPANVRRVAACERDLRNGK